MIHRPQNFDLIKESLDVFNVCQVHLVENFDSSLRAGDHRFNLPHLAKSPYAQKFSDFVEIIEVALVFSHKVTFGDRHACESKDGLVFLGAA